MKNGIEFGIELSFTKPERCFRPYVRLVDLEKVRLFDTSVEAVPPKASQKPAKLWRLKI